MRNRTRYSIPHYLAISAASASLGFGLLTSEVQAARGASDLGSEASTILAASDQHDTVYDRRDGWQDDHRNQRDDRQDNRCDRRHGRRDNRCDRRDGRQDGRQDRRDDRQDNRHDRH